MKYQFAGIHYQYTQFVTQEIYVVNVTQYQTGDKRLCNIQFK